ncbi:MAG TPA: DNA primase [Solibacterales bacterium]|nr:DNA primase [Bryobacterales bacterium]
MDFIAQLKAQVDIVGVIQEYVRLKKAGATYKGLCPFHTEKTPSFTVNPARQFFYCHGCHVGGDVLRFVELQERLTFFEALKMLAERHGIAMPKREGLSDESTKLRGALFEMHAIAEAEFRSALHSPAGAAARDYLKRRGVGEAACDQFGLGLALKGGSRLVQRFQKEGFTPEEIETSGLGLRREEGGLYDRFRGRLMFPIHSESGKIIAFGGRALEPEDQPKYLNSPETPIYKKGSVLYNLHRAKEGVRKADRSVLVEGYMDVIGVWSSGVAEVVASCGTALTAQQVQSVRRHSANMVLNFDPDSAGAAAAEKSIQMLLDEHMRIRIVALEGGLDPDEFVQKHGPEAYRQRLDGAKNYFHWLADRARSRFDMRSAEGRVAVFQFLLPAIQGLGDKLERGSVVNDVAGYLQVEPGLVLENFRKLAVDRKEKVLAPPAAELIRPLDRILLGALLSSAEAREHWLPEIRQMRCIERSAGRRLYLGLAGLADSGAEITFGALHARLEEADQKILCQNLLREDEGGTLEQAAACMDQLRLEEATLRLTELKGQIKEAERSGNLAEALRLYGELQGGEKGV